MKILPSLALVLLALVAVAPAAADMTLTADERAELVTLLEDSRRQFEELTALTTGEAWNQPPAEGKWSVGEVAEHLVLAEEGILAFAQSALEGEIDPEWEARTATTVENLIATLGDRSQKFQAPEQFQPNGEMSRAELIEKFGMLRARTLDYARTTDDPVKGYTIEGPPGKMNVHQWLGLIGAHTLRHNAQIAEAQAMLAGEMPAEAAEAPAAAAADAGD